jgi:hypothetical protein
LVVGGASGTVAKSISAYDKEGSDNLGLVLETIGRRVLERAFENSVKAIEPRNGAPREGVAS